jgi:hypothetical protein
VQLLPLSCYFIPLRSKYYPQNQIRFHTHAKQLAELWSCIFLNLWQCYILLRIKYLGWHRHFLSGS